MAGADTNPASASSAAASLATMSANVTLSAIPTTAIKSATTATASAHNGPVTSVLPFECTQPLNTATIVLGTVVALQLLIIALLIRRNRRLTRRTETPLCSTDPYTTRCVDAAYTDDDGHPVLPIYVDDFGSVTSLTPLQESNL